jgi:ribosome biogenesis GTPase
MEKGRIVKSISGFYYVLNDDGIFQCRGRGNFRKKGLTPLVGDFVDFEAANRTDGYILAINDRKNELNRPPISNVDQAILVFSVAEPEFNPLLLDRFLVHVEANNIRPVICFTKSDLLKETAKLEAYIKDYNDIGYEVVFTSSKAKSGMEELHRLFHNYVTVFAGQSGVGKSSLLNELNPELKLATNEISNSLGRGKHTTRHVELIPFGDGLVADTPGFSSLDFVEIEPEELSNYFPEMKNRAMDCKFRECTHDREPKCAVKEAVKAGEIKQYRYDHYLSFLQEVRDQFDRRYD